MILPEWIEPAAAGFFCKPGGFFFDPRRPVARAVISHGHADHFVRGNRAVHATAPTLALGFARYKRNACKESFVHSFGESFTLGSVNLSLWPAGHLIGSAQILAEYNGERLLFSGDIQTTADPTCEPLEVPPGPIHCLISESTFGLKESHPDPGKMLDDYVALAGIRPLLIGVYASGKAQFINRMLNERYPELPVYIHPSMHPFYKVYEQFAISPGKYEVLRRAHLRSEHRFALLVPVKNMSSFARDIRFCKAIASGWDHRKQHPHLDAMLEISGHADFKGLADYLKRVNPARAAFWHGYPSQLKKLCEELGIPSAEVHLPELK